MKSQVNADNIFFALFCVQIQHPLIAEFPSKRFYDGKLLTAPDHECRGIRLLSIWRRDITQQPIPLMFCHVEGAEKALTVTTSEGNEQSRSNDLERDEAVRITYTFKKLGMLGFYVYIHIHVYIYVYIHVYMYKKDPFYTPCSPPFSGSDVPTCNLRLLLELRFS